MREATLPEFSRICEAYHARVVACAAMLIGRDEAEDVAQEVFVKIRRSPGTLADPSRMVARIYAITLNAVREAARSRSSRSGRSTGPAEAARGAGNVRRPSESGGGARTPEETAIRREMVACYLDLVKDLPRNYLDVFVPSEFEHLSNEEIARRLSISPATVKIRLHRARARLHKQIRRLCRCHHIERGELMAEPKRR